MTTENSKIAKPMISRLPTFKPQSRSISNLTKDIPTETNKENRNPFKVPGKSIPKRHAETPQIEDAPKPKTSKTVPQKLSRRSNTVMDFRPNHFREIKMTVGKPSLMNLRSKLQTPVVEEKPKVTRAPKPAPYDYKARFTLVSERFAKLKSDHGQLKTNYDEEVEKTNDLIEKNIALTKEKEKLLLELKHFNELSKLVDVLKPENEQLKNLLSKTESERDIYRNKLDEITSKFDVISKENSSLKTQVAALNNQLSEAAERIKFLIECSQAADTERRKMHNTIQDLKGNIRVFCRVRPVLESEDKLPCRFSFTEETIEIAKSKESVSVSALSKGRNGMCDFQFDRVFAPRATQEEVFLELSQLVQSVLDGYNVCVFAYGQTGSGKTYTMEGSRDSKSLGMVPRGVDFLFNMIQNLQVLGWSYTVQACFIEIYNERIYDLLDFSKEQNHEIRMSDKEGTDVYVTNLRIEEIASATHLKDLMKVAQQNRAIAATENNERSSRSHAVHKITVTGVNVQTNEKCQASLNFVDLAGSERLGNSDNVRATETKNINKSLSELGNVILALHEKKDYVPYRNSKLTHLLKPCLGGTSKTLMLANICPFEDCFGESINTLRFAAKVNQCKTGNVRKNKTELS